MTVEDQIPKRKFKIDFSAGASADSVNYVDSSDYENTADLIEGLQRYDYVEEWTVGQVFDPQIDRVYEIMPDGSQVLISQPFGSLSELSRDLKAYFAKDNVE